MKLWCGVTNGAQRVMSSTYDVVEGAVLDADVLLGLGPPRPGVVDDLLDGEGLEALGDRLADAAQADDADSLALEGVAERVEHGAGVVLPRVLVDSTAVKQGYERMKVTSEK